MKTVSGEIKEVIFKIEEVDVHVHNCGSLYLFDLLTEDAKTWVEENVSEDRTFFGKNSLVVEHRFADELARGMIADGLEVR